MTDSALDGSNFTISSQAVTGTFFGFFTQLEECKFFTKLAITAAAGGQVAV